MAERDRAAVYVDPALLDPQHADRVQGDRREGLVDLPQVDVPGLQASLLQRLARGARGSRRQIGEVVRALSVGNDLCQRGLAVRLRPLLRGQHERASAVVYARRVARGVRTVLSREPRQRRELLQRCVTARPLVDLHALLALAIRDRHGDDLLGHAPLIGRQQGAFVRAQRPAVEVSAGELELVCDLGRLDEHLLARERVGEPVVDHRIEHLRVPHAIAETCLREQVGRARHRLHPSSNTDLQLAGADRLVQQHRGAQARRAHLVDGLRGHLLGDAGFDLCLARGDLALTSLQDLAHDDVFDLLGRDLRALQRRFDREPAELGRFKRRKPAPHLADGGARGTEDHGLWHGSAFRWCFAGVAARQC